MPVPAMFAKYLILFTLLCSPDRYPTYLVDSHYQCLAQCRTDGIVIDKCDIDLSYCLKDAQGSDCAFAYPATERGMESLWHSKMDWARAKADTMLEKSDASDVQSVTTGKDIKSPSEADAKPDEMKLNL